MRVLTVQTRDKLIQTSAYRRATTATTANMGAVVGTLTMQTKQRRLSMGEGTHTQTLMHTHMHTIIYT